MKFFHRRTYPEIDRHQNILDTITRSVSFLGVAQIAGGLALREPLLTMGGFAEIGGSNLITKFHDYVLWRRGYNRVSQLAAHISADESLTDVEQRTLIDSIFELEQDEIKRLNGLLRDINAPAKPLDWVEAHSAFTENTRNSADNLDGLGLIAVMNVGAAQAVAGGVADQEPENGILDMSTPTLAGLVAYLGSGVLLAVTAARDTR